MKKYKWLYAIPAVVGLYLIYLQIKKKKPSIKINEVVVPPNVPTNTGGVSVYPLKKGSKNDTVKLLQGILNMSLPMPNPYIISGGTINKLVVDGDFGSKTEAALNAIAGVKQINSASEFQSVITSVKNSSNYSDSNDSGGLFDPSGVFKNSYSNDSSSDGGFDIRYF